MITIAAWNKCNNNCLMCTNPPGYKKEKDYDYGKLIDRYKNLDPEEREIYLTGGEPVLHPHFFDFLDFLRKKCPESKITIVTNGRLFSYSEFARKCLSRGNISFQIAVHGPNARLHDKITGAKGSFEQTISGIRNLLKLKPEESEIELRVIIHRLTVSHLKDIHYFLVRSFPGANRIVFIFMEMEGMAGVNIRRVGTKYKQALPYLRELFRDFKNSPTEIRLYHFPLCVLPSEFWPYAWRTLPAEEIVFLPFCNKCQYKDYCLGIHRMYQKHKGIKEFHPLRRKNSEVQFSEDFYHPIKKYGH